jgi:hypothetical protein
MDAESSGHGDENALTSIGTSIHCAATAQGAAEAEVNALLEALAEVAMSIAKRSQENGTAKSEPV